MRKLLLSCLVMLLPATAALADQPIKVTGCVIKQVEFGCLALRTVAGKTYNISAATPTPTPDTYGRVEGTLRTGWITYCQSKNIINPAAWTMIGKLCPLHKAKKK
jgi:hypothetical protein